MIDFLTANWLWIALIALVVAMHRGGGCGSHGNHGGHGRHDQRDAGPGRDEHAGHR